jgi:hypothetical protein
LPFGQGGRGHVEFARDAFQVFASDQALDAVGLSLGGEEAALTGDWGARPRCWLLGLDTIVFQREVQRNAEAADSAAVPRYLVYPAFVLYDDGARGAG